MAEMQNSNTDGDSTVLCGANSYVEKYYLNDKLNILQDTYTQINAYAMEKAAAGEDIMDDLQSLYSKDGEQNEITRLIRNINEKYNITIVVVDSTNGETYPSFWDGRFLADRVQQYILGRRRRVESGVVGWVPR